MRYIIERKEKKQVVIKGAGRHVVELRAEGAEVEVLGALRIKGDKEEKVEIEVRHRVGKTKSEVRVRAVVAGRAKLNLGGLIKVYPGAEKIQAFLTEKVLLMSRQARAEAIPKLEIEANELVCSHAATVSGFDQREMFYLKSRGVRRMRAKKLLAEGFLAEVIKKIENNS